jgi:hypothetical protein
MQSLVHHVNGELTQIRILQMAKICVLSQTRSLMILNWKSIMPMLSAPLQGNILLSTNVRGTWVCRPFATMVGTATALKFPCFRWILAFALIGPVGLLLARLD